MISRITKSSSKLKYSLVSTVVAIALLSIGSANADTLSKEQGDAILGELKQIRQLLEKQQKPVPFPEPPKVQSDKIKTKLNSGDIVMGSKEAPLTLIEYTDYQCSFCNRFETGTFPELKKNFIDTGKLRFVVRDLPLDFHTNALKAAEATRCAGDQDKYWQMREIFIKNPSKIEPASFIAFAEELSLDMPKYKSCLNDGKYLAEIKNSMQAANGLGITGTPSFVLAKTTGDLVDGSRIVGALPYPAFETRMNEMLKK